MNKINNNNQISDDFFIPVNTNQAVGQQPVMSQIAQQTLGNVPLTEEGASLTTRVSPKVLIT